MKSLKIRNMVTKLLAATIAVIFFVNSVIADYAYSMQVPSQINSPIFQEEANTLYGLSMLKKNIENTRDICGNIGDFYFTVALNLADISHCKADVVVGKDDKIVTPQEIENKLAGLTRADGMRIVNEIADEILIRLNNGDIILRYWTPAAKVSDLADAISVGEKLAMKGQEKALAWDTYYSKEFAERLKAMVGTRQVEEAAEELAQPIFAVEKAPVAAPAEEAAVEPSKLVAWLTTALKAAPIVVLVLIAGYKFLSGDTTDHSDHIGPAAGVGPVVLAGLMFDRIGLWLSGLRSRFIGREEHVVEGYQRRSLTIEQLEGKELLSPVVPIDSNPDLKIDNTPALVGPLTAGQERGGQVVASPANVDRAVAGLYSEGEAGIGAEGEETHREWRVTVGTTSTYLTLDPRQFTMSWNGNTYIYHRDLDMVSYETSQDDGFTFSTRGYGKFDQAIREMELNLRYIGEDGLADRLLSGELDNEDPTRREWRRTKSNENGTWTTADFTLDSKKLAVSIVVVDNTGAKRAAYKYIYDRNYDTVYALYSTEDDAGAYVSRRWFYKYSTPATAMVSVVKFVGEGDLGTQLRLGTLYNKDDAHREWVVGEGAAATYLTLDSKQLRISWYGETYLYDRDLDMAGHETSPIYGFVFSRRGYGKFDQEISAMTEKLRSIGEDGLAYRLGSGGLYNYRQVSTPPFEDLLKPGEFDTLADLIINSAKSGSVGSYFTEISVQRSEGGEWKDYEASNLFFDAGRGLLLIQNLKQGNYKVPGTKVPATIVNLVTGEAALQINPTTVDVYKNDGRLITTFLGTHDIGVTGYNQEIYNIMADIELGKLSAYNKTDPFRSVVNGAVENFDAARQAVRELIADLVPDATIQIDSERSIYISTYNEWRITESAANRISDIVDLDGVTTHYEVPDTGPTKRIAYDKNGTYISGNIDNRAFEYGFDRVEDYRHEVFRLRRLMVSWRNEITQDPERAETVRLLDLAILEFDNRMPTRNKVDYYYDANGVLKARVPETGEFQRPADPRYYQGSLEGRNYWFDSIRPESIASDGSRVTARLIEVGIGQSIPPVFPWEEDILTPETGFNGIARPNDDELREYLIRLDRVVELLHRMQGDVASVVRPIQDQFQALRQRVYEAFVKSGITLPQFTVYTPGKENEYAIHRPNGDLETWTVRKIGPTYLLHLESRNGVPIRFDVNQDGFVTPIDALIVINFINEHGTGMRDGSVDVNEDGFVTPIDVLQIINYFNRQTAAGETAAQISAEGEAYINEINRTIPGLPPDARMKAKWDGRKGEIVVNVSAGPKDEKVATAYITRPTPPKEKEQPQASMQPMRAKKAEEEDSVALTRKAAERLQAKGMTKATTAQIIWALASIVGEKELERARERGLPFEEEKPDDERLKTVFKSNPNDNPVLVKIPVEALENLSADEVRARFGHYLLIGNLYIQLFSMDDPNATIRDRGVYERYGLAESFDKKCPLSFETKQNTITLWCSATAVNSPGELQRPEYASVINSIVLTIGNRSPDGGIDDPTGIMRGIYFGARGVQIARYVKTALGGRQDVSYNDLKEPEIREYVDKTVKEYKHWISVFGLPPEIRPEELEAIGPQLFVDIATSLNVNKVFRALKTLIRLTPIVPFDWSAFAKLRDALALVDAAA